MPEQSQITVNLTSEDDFILNGALNFIRPKKSKTTHGYHFTIIDEWS
jgi:hypothetical protein